MNKKGPDPLGQKGKKTRALQRLKVAKQATGQLRLLQAQKA